MSVIQHKGQNIYGKTDMQKCSNNKSTDGDSQRINQTINSYFTYVYIINFV